MRDHTKYYSILWKKKFPDCLTFPVTESFLILKMLRGTLKLGKENRDQQRQMEKKFLKKLDKDEQTKHSGRKKEITKIRQK